jgi:hypothetical protein
MGLIIVHGMWLPIHLIFFVVWSSFSLGKHKEVKLFNVIILFLHNSCEELKNNFFDFHLKTSFFLTMFFFLSNGLWGAQIKTILDCSIRLFHMTSWCDLLEKTLLVGAKELTRRTNVFLSKLIMCHMLASLEQFKMKWGY